MDFSESSVCMYNCFVRFVLEANLMFHFFNFTKLLGDWEGREQVSVHAAWQTLTLITLESRVYTSLKCGCTNLVCVCILKTKEAVDLAQDSALSRIRLTRLICKAGASA